MKVIPIRAKKFMRDTNGAALTVGQVADVDAVLGNAWAAAGLVRIVEHDPPTGPACVVEKNEHYYRQLRREQERNEEPQQGDDDGNQQERPVPPQRKRGRVDRAG